jgi:tetratricopeptide (TPR) repeat protein
VKQRTLAVTLVVAGAMFLAGCSNEPRWTTTSPAAIPWLEQGVQYWQRFLYTEAFAAIDSALAKDSTFAVAWGRRALLLYATNSLQEARTTITRAGVLASHATPRERHLIRLWSCRINDLRAEEAALADSLIAMYPEDPELYLIRGQCYETERKFEAAVRLYSQSVERDTGFALGVMSLGYTYSTLGEQERAVEYMQRYILMAPDQPDPRASYADILVRAGRYDEALEQYRAALTIKADYWYAVREIGTVYLIKGRLHEAERQFEDAVRMLPPSMATEAALLRLRGAVDIQRGTFEDALALFRAAQAIDSSYLNQSYPMALSLSRLGRFPEAQEVIDSTYAEVVRRQLTGTPYMEIFHLMRARVFTEEGKLDSAEAACRDAMENSTPLTRGRVYVHLARVYRAARNWDAALDAIESALAVTPDAPEALLTLTMVYVGMGDVAMAKEIGRRLMDLWRDADPDFRLLLELKQTLGTAVPRVI